MLISQDAGMADPIVMSRVIANALLSELRESHGRRVQRLSVVNILRLLETYDADAFHIPEPLGILEHSISDFDDVRRVRGFKRLKTALQSTHHALQPTATRSEFVDTTSALLRSLLPESTSGSPPEVQDFTGVERFLSELTNALSGD
jgi:hypothetical protein